MEEEGKEGKGEELEYAEGSASSGFTICPKAFFSLLITNWQWRTRRRKEKGKNAFGGILVLRNLLSSSFSLCKARGDPKREGGEGGFPGRSRTLGYFSYLFQFSFPVVDPKGKRGGGKLLKSRKPARTTRASLPHHLTGNSSSHSYGDDRKKGRGKKKKERLLFQSGPQ